MSINLEAMLQYQVSDIERRKLLDEIERNEDNKKLEQARTEFNSAKILISDSEKAAENIVNYYNSALNYYENSSKEIDDLGAKLESSDSEDECSKIIEKLESLKEKFTELEQVLAKSREKTEKVIHAYLDGQDRGKKIRDVYNAIKTRLDAFKKEKEPRLQQLNSQLNTMGKGIDAEILKQYNILTQERKYPAFVEAILTDDKKNYRCYCGLAISQKSKGDLLEKGISRCETCRRIIYKS